MYSGCSCKQSAYLVSSDRSYEYSRQHNGLNRWNIRKVQTLLDRHFVRYMTAVERYAVMAL